MRLFLLTIATCLLAYTPGWAQLNPLGNLGAGEQPLELESDEGLELHQDRQMVVARGNVIVRQGDIRLRADVVSASYKDINGKRSIHRVDAVGNVEIKTLKERLLGEHATYDLQRELFLMKGKNLRIEAEKQTVTARESLEYWGKEKRAVARGDATAIQNEDNTTIRADVIEAQLAARNAAAGSAAVANAAAGPESLSLDAVRAWGNVLIRTTYETIKGDTGTYNAATRVATLEGNVRITRGKNQLNGEKAIIDMGKGVSRLIAAPGKRVRSIFYPGSAGIKTPGSKSTGPNHLIQNPSMRSLPRQSLPRPSRPIPNQRMPKWKAKRRLHRSNRCLLASRLCRGHARQRRVK